MTNQKANRIIEATSDVAKLNHHQQQQRRVALREVLRQQEAAFVERFRNLTNEAQPER